MAMANGNRKQTLRNNIVQPYSAGFLAKEDHKDYNAVMGIELDKIETSTKHMFQGLDDLRSEVDERTKALQALHLSVNDQFNRVMLEISGVKMQLGQGITVDSITDADGNVLSGVLQGLKTQVNAANGNVTVLLGEIVNTNTKFDGQIIQIEDKFDGEIQAITGIINNTDPANPGLAQRVAKNETDIGLADNRITQVQSLTETTDALGNHSYKARWEVKTNVNDLVGGVGFLNDGTPGGTSFTVNADKFNFTGSGSSNGDLPFYIDSSGTHIKQASVDNITIGFGKVTGTLESNNYASSGDGWRLERGGNFTMKGNNGALEITRDHIRIMSGGVERIYLGL